FYIIAMESVRVFLKSFGCSTNLADGEVMAGCLAKAGFKLVDSVADADIVIYNTCAVKSPTENRIIDMLKKVPKGKKLLVVGCLPLINFDRLHREVCFNGVAGPALGEKIIDIINEVLGGRKVVALENADKAKPSLNLPRIRINPVVGIIPINYGCLGSCAYCCVVFARGRLRSYSIKEIVERVKADLADGVREFWLTSQDTACYGRDMGTNLAELIKEICAINGDFKVRVGMMTPNMAMSILENLIEAYKNEKIFKFLHLPVQSGDDYVLKKMRRLYTVADFKEVVSAFRAAFPKITIVTDVICGFPGENEEAFKKTLKLIKDVKPEIVNISKFFARPRTPAATMQDAVPFPERKRRSAALSGLALKVSLEKNREWVGWEGEVLIDEKGKVPCSWIGRNFAYKPVVVKSNENLLGKIVHVKVSKAFSTYLEGELVDHNSYKG
ncbi:tRNA (N(6)-L-threonylcarbamoyladenosine(37)-C(2))-methylthiotransferase, partial [Candidatus Bathyarchaeota archaeon]|nr:tRNA (N(6)-L-threonylcarbamoyladenosine(37)-C(2))-methylthiotransferase [Candidatus Bathyarchaeota archaeon]